MQMKKTIGILLAVCFLMSVTAAAVSARPFDHDRDKIKAVDDKFNLTPKKNTGNVLDNDKGKNLVVKSFTKAKKGKLSVRKNGKFTYTPYNSRDKLIKDSFKYTIMSKDGKQKSTAKVTIIFENKRNERGDNNHGHNNRGDNNRGDNNRGDTTRGDNTTRGNNTN